MQRDPARDLRPASGVESSRARVAASSGDLVLPGCSGGFFSAYTVAPSRLSNAWRRLVMAYTTTAWKRALGVAESACRIAVDWTAVRSYLGRNWVIRWFCPRFVVGIVGVGSTPCAAWRATAPLMYS